MTPTNAELLREHNNGALSYAALAKKYRLTRNQVAGRIRRAKQSVGFPTPARVVDFPAAVRTVEKPVDWDQWQDSLRGLSKKRYVTVCHVADVHFPDHNESALFMAYRLIARKQPDLLIVGSDTADFSVISTFGPNPDSDEQVDDALFNFRDYWRPHIDSLSAAAPKAIKVMIHGNHENRIYRHMQENAPKLRRTVEQAWIESIRYRGVLWIGRTDEVEISHLLVQHGSRSSEHVSKAMLEDQAYQVHVMAGHVHRLTSYTREGRKYPVTAITSGCLCQLIPSYAQGKRPRRAWQHGVAFATVDMQGTDVFFENIRFSHVDGRLTACSDSDILVQAVTA